MQFSALKGLTPTRNTGTIRKGAGVMTDLVHVPAIIMYMANYKQG